MQLRDDKAHAFAMTFKERPLELGELAFGLLANNLRFVVPNRNESNKSRWKNLSVLGTLFRGCGSLKTASTKTAKFP